METSCKDADSVNKSFSVNFRYFGAPNISIEVITSILMFTFIRIVLAQHSACPAAGWHVLAPCDNSSVFTIDLQPRKIYSRAQCDGKTRSYFRRNPPCGFALPKIVSSILFAENNSGHVFIYSTAYRKTSALYSEFICIFITRFCCGFP